MNHLLIKYGELALKGKNRKYFEQTLIKRIREVLKITPQQIHLLKGRIYIDWDGSFSTIEKLQKIFGIVEICISSETELEERKIGEVVLEKLSSMDLQEKTFRVSVRRPNKSFPMGSMELARKIAGVVLKKYGSELSVDLHNPDIHVEIEIREKAQIYIERYPGPGGMPLSTGGKTMVLLSGGIDSPVALYQMGRRGVRIFAMHFHAFPFTSEMEQEKISMLLKQLSPFVSEVTLYHVNILKAQEEIRDKVPPSYFTVMQRRVMMRLATKMAKRKNIRSLSTGENLAQVSSQTMAAIHCINNATDLPVFRPLISFDKEDIVKIARDIGTFDISVLPYEDCCSIFAPGKVEVHPQLKEVLALESKMNIREIENEIFSTIVTKKITTE